jgi:hypothetical protein
MISEDKDDDDYVYGECFGAACIRRGWRNNELWLILIFIVWLCCNHTYCVYSNWRNSVRYGCITAQETRVERVYTPDWTSGPEPFNSVYVLFFFPIIFTHYSWWHCLIFVTRADVVDWFRSVSSSALYAALAYSLLANPPHLQLIVCFYKMFGGTP